MLPVDWEVIHQLPMVKGSIQQLVEIRDIIAASDGETTFVSCVLLALAFDVPVRAVALVPDRWDMPMRFDRFLGFVFFYTFSAEPSTMMSIQAALQAQPTRVCAADWAENTLVRARSSLRLPRLLLLLLRLLPLLLPAFDVLVCAVASAFSAVVDGWGVLPVGFDRFLGVVILYTFSAKHFIVAIIQTTRHA